ncbi:Abi family protein [Pantoea agglomerans]|uniref:Abi family protein n=1 Tax=Enterobacter agglomerans TaxID=549 RepID=UPI00165414E4|nr:Abi family protein [Pantoea agglomerans]
MTAQQLITSDRLDIYEKHLKVKTDQVMAAYHWNKALAGAMLPALQCLEITLRNAIDMGIRSFPPPAAAGLYETNHNWIFTLPRYMGNRTFRRPNERYRQARRVEARDAQGFALDAHGKRIIARKIPVETMVDNAKSEIARLNKTLTPGRVISGLSFGFWTQLLTHHYENRPGQSHNLLWPHLTNVVFPYAPTGWDREKICDAFFRIKDLRNRLSHHEAMWKFHYDDPATGKPDYSNPVYGALASCSLLRKHYDDMIEMIGWMSPDRKANFLNHSANLRFYALCSVDGLNSYIAPEKIKAQIKVSRGGKGINRLIKILEKNEFIRIVSEGQTVLTIGSDNSILI